MAGCTGCWEKSSGVDVLFYMLCMGRRKAVDYSLHTVRMHYKDAPIIVFENGSSELKEVCDNHRASYVQQPLNYIKPSGEQKYAMISDFDILFEQMCRVSAMAHEYNVKWVVYLEPDVILKRKVSVFPEADIGASLHAFNRFNSTTYEFIQNQDGSTKGFNRYGFQGGAIVSLQAFTCVCSNVSVWQTATAHALAQSCDTGICCGDMFQSMVFLLLGFEIEDWKEHCELHIHDEERVMGAAVAHGFKKHY